MKIYYGHCKGIYGTPQEVRDLELLNNLGFEIINPNEPGHARGCKDFPNPMEYFHDLVSKCDALAFRALPDGSIPIGVGQEIRWAQNEGKPVIELPHFALRKCLDLEETREYLREIGER